MASSTPRCSTGCSAAFGSTETNWNDWWRRSVPGRASKWTFRLSYPVPSPPSDSCFLTLRSHWGSWTRNGMPLSCLLCQDCSFFPLICWGFCSKNLCTPEPYYKLEVSPKRAAVCSVFLFPLFSFWVCGWSVYIQPHLRITVLFSSWNTQKHRFSKVWPLILLSHCHFTIWTGWCLLLQH